MTPAEIARRRAAAQRLSAPGRESPAALVTRLAAVQAQDYGLAKWSVAQRLAGGTPAAVERALAGGAILRTHVLRPTWHLVPRDDLRWMQQLTAPRVRALMAYNDRRNGVTAELVGRSIKAVAAAIERRGHLTRSEVASVLAAARIRVNPWLVAQLLVHAELAAVICSGAPRGRQQTYALVDERAPRSRRLAGDEALVELARRYFRSHGPATLKDFRWWSGLEAAAAARAVAALGRQLEAVPAESRTYYRAAPREPARRAASAHLVQPFDELLVGYSESRDIVDPGGAARRRGWGLLLNAVVVDGELVGRWRYDANTRGRRAVVLELLRQLTAPERAAVRRAQEEFVRATSA